MVVEGAGVSHQIIKVQPRPTVHTPPLSASTKVGSEFVDGGKHKRAKMISHRRPYYERVTQSHNLGVDHTLPSPSLNIKGK